MKGKCLFKKGVISKTKMQEKKHVNQMSFMEQNVILGEIELSILKFSSIKFSRHVEEKVSRGDVDFSKSRLINTLKKGEFNIIEFNKTVSNRGVDKRVLLRSSFSEKVSYFDKKGNTFTSASNLCFVYSLVKGEVVTAYWNKVTDKHDSLDLRRYSDSLDVIEELSN